jgi:hypothetical protein
VKTGHASWLAYGFAPTLSFLGSAHQQLSEVVRIGATPTVWNIKAESIMNRRPRMAFAFQGQFDPECEAQMRGFYETLSEKDGRRFAVLQAKLLGYGGITYIAGVLGCSAKTIERGAHELDGLPDDPLAGRIRAVGGGRKKRSRPNPSLSRI